MKMNRKIVLIFISVFALISLSAAGDTDKFDIIKEYLAKAGLIQLDILIEIESDIFEDIDTLTGNISIASDGRYHAKINNDIYLYDGRTIWDYSAENNQATKKVLDENEEYENRLVFLKELDRHFATDTIIPDSTYKMFRLADADEACPDSMEVTISQNPLRISRIEYFDLNGDLNRIFIKNQVLSDSADAGLFRINLPDTVEIIFLP